jgi:hypothetical protein
VLGIEPGEGDAFGRFGHVNEDGAAAQGAEEVADAGQNDRSKGL